MSKAAFIVLILGLVLGVTSDHYFSAGRKIASFDADHGVEKSDAPSMAKSKSLKRKIIARPPANINEEPAAPPKLAPPPPPINVETECADAGEGERITGFTGYRRRLPQICPEDRAGTRQFVQDEIRTFECHGGRWEPVGRSRFKVAGYDDSGCEGLIEETSFN